MTPLSNYLAATCLYAAFGLPFMMGAAQIRRRPAPAMAASPPANTTPRR